LEPDAVNGLDEDALFGLYRLESGAIDASYVSKSSGNVLTALWEPGWPLPVAEGTDWELRVSSEAPASILSLTGVALPASSE
jgi:hypothetical protein